MSVVAEGVEESQSLAILKRTKVDLIQGWIDGKPVTLEQLDAIISQPDWMNMNEDALDVRSIA